MAHYAKVVDGIVDKVIVAEADFFDTFIDSSPGQWIETSPSGSIRKQYAGIGYIYDDSNDVFIKQKPYPSWSLDASHDWQPPVTMPDDGKVYEWDEATTNWVEIE